jgi:TonB-linked SusC/RagA family outer membrane protein
MFKTIQIIVMATLCLIFNSRAQGQNPLLLPKKQAILGKVISSTTGEALPGAVIKVTAPHHSTVSNHKGEFILTLSNGTYNISISHLGYKTKSISIQIPLKELLVIALDTDDKNLQEVEIVSTGYQNIPKERTTGSFAFINNELLNRSVTTNVLDRIKDLVPGIYFQERDISLFRVQMNPNNKSSGIAIRGESTFLASKEPLIILDNFPYEGDMKNINPNDIESITLLKDAAAASIWGARSGNGVIVITTKKGKAKQALKIDFNSNVMSVNKPNLFYAKTFLNAKSYIEVEKVLYDNGYFNAQLNDVNSYPTVSPSVELMRKIDLSNSEEEKLQIQTVLDALANHDIRNDYNKYVYQKALSRQYSLGLRGGTDNLTYTLSFGHDNNKDNLIRNGYSRTSINSYESFKIAKGLDFTTGINYSQNTTNLNNMFGFGQYASTGNPYGGIFPYAKLADDNGKAMPIPQRLRSTYLASMEAKGFLDWNFRPLDEIYLADNQTKVNNLLLRLGLAYQITPQLNMQVNYQNERQLINERNYRNEDTYYARNLINQFSIYNPTTGAITYNFPKGGILDIGNTEWQQNNLRAQINYDQTLNIHRINLLAGAEIRQLRTQSSNRTYYGYDDQFGSSSTNLNFKDTFPINPSGAMFIPAPDGFITGVINRHVSYFTLGSYSYDEKYTLNASARLDGANLFGVKVNNRITPLWSAGLGWDLSRENFYQFSLIPKIRFRATYGYQGNTSNGSAFLSGSYNINADTGAPYINVSSAPNPMLQWEKIRNVNIALDFSSKNSILSGSIELFKKKGKNLIQPTSLAPQTGFSTFRANTASLATNGLEITLQTSNLKRKLKWNTTLLFSHINDKVLKYDADRTSASVSLSGSAAGSALVVGKPSYAIFSYKWAGLNPLNGNPRGFLNGNLSEDYAGIINNYHVDSIKYNGSARPTAFGSLRNDFSYQRFSLSVNISYRFGYVFRRASTNLNYAQIIQSGQHADYDLRWQKTGDELNTQVPSVVYPTIGNRNTFYQFSEILVEPGDHIRLQDFRLAYQVPLSFAKKLNAVNIKLFTYVNNIGIIWRKNKHGIDPSNIGSGALYPNPMTFSFGLNANL